MSYLPSPSLSAFLKIILETMRMSASSSVKWPSARTTPCVRARAAVSHALSYAKWDELSYALLAQ